MKSGLLYDDLKNFYQEIFFLVQDSEFLNHLLDSKFISSSEFFLNQSYFQVDFRISEKKESKGFANFFFNKPNLISGLEGSYQGFINQKEHYLIFKNTREIFVVLENIKNNISNFNQKNLSFPFFKSLEEEIDLFIKIYEFWLNKYNLQGDYMGPIILQSLKLSSSLKTTLELCKNISEKQEQDFNQLTAEQLVLTFDSKTSFAKSNKRQNAINRVYSEICTLFKVSEKNHPLEIVKVEKNGQIIEIQGLEEVIVFMKDTLVLAIKYLHNSYIENGEVNKISKNVLKIENILKVQNRLENLDENTETNEDNIKMASAMIADTLNKFLLNESQIVINDQEFSIYKKLRAKFTVKSGNESDLKNDLKELQIKLEK